MKGNYGPFKPYPNKCNISEKNEKIPIQILLTRHQTFLEIKFINFRGCAKTVDVKLSLMRPIKRNTGNKSKTRWEEKKQNVKVGGGEGKFLSINFLEILPFAHARTQKAVILDQEQKPV